MRTALIAATPSRLASSRPASLPAVQNVQLHEPRRARPMHARRWLT